MKYFPMMVMQPQKAILQYPVIRVGLAGILVFFSCKSTKLTRDEAEIYSVINSVITGYSSKINNKVYLTKYIIEKDSWILKNIFNDSTGYLYKEICHEKVKLKKTDFIASIQEKNLFTGWNYKKIRNKSLVSEIVLNEDEKEKYEKSTIKDMLKTDYELDTYKYILWNNPYKVPLIRLSLPYISKDRNSAIINISKHSDGIFVWILEKKNKKWIVSCEKRLSHY